MKTNRRKSKRGNDKGAIGAIYNRVMAIPGKAERWTALTLFWALLVPGFVVIGIACWLYVMAVIVIVVPGWMDGREPFIGWWERPAAVVWVIPLLVWAAIRWRKISRENRRIKEVLHQEKEAIAEAERRRSEERRRIEAQQRIAEERRAQAREEAARREREAAAERERRARRATMTTHPEEALSRIQQWDPYDVEKVIAALLRVTPGYRHVNVTPPGADGGIDICATFTDGHGVKRPVGVQVKRQIRDVGGPLVRNLRGSLQAEAKGMFYSTGGFNQGAIKEAGQGDKPGGMIELIDGPTLGTRLSKAGIRVGHVSGEFECPHDGA